MMGYGQQTQGPFCCLRHLSCVPEGGREGLWRALYIFPCP